jgi:hypothetical protein
MVLRIHLRVFQSRNGHVAGWLCLQSRPVSCVVCALLSPPRPLPNLLHILVPPLALQTPLTLDSLIGPPASVISVLLGSPAMSPQLPPRSRFSSCSPQVSCQSGTPTRSAMMRFQFLVWMSLPPFSFLPMLLLPHLPTVLMKFPLRDSHTVLLWFRVMVMLRFLSRTPVFLAFPPPLPSASYRSPSTCPAGWRPHRRPLGYG